MRILRDFKIPEFKFKKIEMDEIPEIDNVNVDYEKVKEATEKKNKKMYKNMEETFKGLRIY